MFESVIFEFLVKLWFRWLFHILVYVFIKFFIKNHTRKLFKFAIFLRLQTTKTSWTRFHDSTDPEQRPEGTNKQHTTAKTNSDITVDTINTPDTWRETHAIWTTNHRIQYSTLNWSSINTRYNHNTKKTSIESLQHVLYNRIFFSSKTSSPDWNRKFLIFFSSG